MSARRLRLRILADRELAAAIAAGLLAAGLLAAGAHKFGTKGLLLPLGLVLAYILVRAPKVMVSLLVALAILCEGPTFGLFHFSSHLYDNLYKGLTPLDVLVALAVISVGSDVVRRRRAFYVPAPLALPLVLLLLAMIAGGVTGHAAGASTRSVLLAENTLAYLLLIPLAVANLELDRRQVMWALGALAALATIKGVFGLVEVFGHQGAAIEGHAQLTYYEPAANWLVMVALLAVAAAALARQKLPVWLLLGAPILIGSIVLSYRRSFWIAAVLGLLLVLLLGTTPVGRRLLLPLALVIAFAIWIAGSIGFQASGSPIEQRVASLAPSKLEANAQDRYRLDERANVLGAIGEHPITGLGMEIPWNATVRSLSVEHAEGRQYVHFAALWYWLKLGILGLVAYVAIMLGGIVLAWQVWRRAAEGAARAFGLASICAFVGLAVIETTASFTGIDPRFTVLFGTQLGMLALLIRSRAASPEAAVPGA